MTTQIEVEVKGDRFSYPALVCGKDGMLVGLNEGFVEDEVIQLRYSVELVILRPSVVCSLYLVAELPSPECLEICRVGPREHAKQVDIFAVDERTVSMSVAGPHEPTYVSNGGSGWRLGEYLCGEVILAAPSFMDRLREHRAGSLPLSFGPRSRPSSLAEHGGRASVFAN
jgi:hypothetical protein